MAASRSTAAQCSSCGLPLYHGNRAPFQAQFKLLYHDRERAYSARLVRLAPGTVYPSHRHARVEELFVIEGEALISGVLMRAGDYCRAESGTVHVDISTSGGVVFFCLASDHNEALD